MNTDFRIAVSFTQHPKTKKLIRKLGYEAFYSLINLWSFVAMNKPDGIMINMDVDDIEIAADWNGECSKFVLALLEHKFIDKDNDVFSIHDWKDHNGYAFYSPQRSEKAKNAAKARWKKRNKKEELMLNDAKSMLQASASNAPAPAPAPAPTPKPTPKPLKNNVGQIQKIPYQEIIEYLNQKTNKHFKHTSKETQNFIKARWNQGFGLNAFKFVIDIKCKKWLTEPKMIDYLRPQTLFGTKFEGYLNETAHPLHGKVSDKTIQSIEALNEWEQKENEKQG